MYNEVSSIRVANVIITDAFFSYYAKDLGNQIKIVTKFTCTGAGRTNLWFAHSYCKLGLQLTELKDFDR